MEDFLQLVLNGVIAGGVYAVAAVSLSLITRILRFFNFAHGELLMLGAYFAYFFTSSLHWPLPLAFAPAMILVGGVALVADRLAYQPLRDLSPLSLLITSMGISILLRNLVQLGWGAQIRIYEVPVRRGLSLGGAFITPTQIGIVATAVGFMVGLWLLLQRSSWGKAIRAIADNRDLARVAGLPVDAVVRASWFVSGCLAGAAGILIGLNTNLQPGMGLSLIVKIFVAMILGGVGSIPGAMAGGLVVGLAENLGIWRIPSGYKDAVAFMVMIVVLLARPQGIFTLRLRAQ